MLSRGAKISGTKLRRPFSWSCVSKQKTDHPFTVYDEYRVFETLLSNRFPSRDDLPYLDHIKKLRLIEQQRRNSQSIMNAKRLESLLARTVSKKKDADVVSFPGADKIRVILDRKSITVNDIDSFLRINLPPNSGLKWVLQALEEFIRQSDKHSLPVISDLLNSYWVLGFEGDVIDNVDAKRLVYQILTRSLQVCPETIYDIQDQEVVPEFGSDAVEAYRHFVDGYLDAYSVDHDDELYDLLFQLASKTGPIEVADAILDQLMQRGIPSSQSIEMFIRSLTNLINAQRMVFVGDDVEFTSKVKHEMKAYRQLLVSEQVNSTVIEFLLLWTSTVDEVYSVLETANQSRHRDAILSGCQIPILNTVVKCGLTEGYTAAMAHMFGVLNRFTTCSAGITAEAFDQCLLLSAIYGNSQGMYRALSMKQGEYEKSPQKTPQHIIGQVFDRLPTIQGEMAKEQQLDDSWWLGNNLKQGEYSMDKAVLMDLRQQIEFDNSKVFQRYLGALGRMGMGKELRDEWSSISKLGAVSQDTIVAFLSAFKAIGDLETGKEALIKVLHESISHHDGQAVSIVRSVFRYEILPIKETIPFVADWLIKHKKEIKWTAQDIELTFKEVTNSMSSLTEDEAHAAVLIGREVADAVIRIQSGKDVNDSIQHLSAILSKS